MKTILSIQSHVAYGYVGNRAAVFPLQRMGYDVIAVNTVQFSNHTGYGEWTGEVFSPAHIEDVLAGLRGKISKVDAVLSGYLGDPAIGEIVLNAVQNFDAPIYCCDPVMGDIGRGFFVREGLPEFFKSRASANAQIMCPNQFELCYLTDSHIVTLDDARAACKKLHDQGVQTILLTSLEHNETREDQIQMLGSSISGAQWLVTTPKLQIDPPPNGAGDCTAAVFLGHILAGAALNQALENTASSIYAVFDETLKEKTRELQIIKAQNAFALPEKQFKAIRLD